MDTTQTPQIVTPRKPGRIRSLYRSARITLAAFSLRVFSRVSGVHRDRIEILPQKRSAALADTTPTGSKNQPVFRDWSTRKAIREGMRLDHMVLSCMNRWTAAIAQPDLIVETRRSRRDKWEAAPDHALQRLLDRPNAYMTTDQLLQLSLTHLFLGGESLISKLRSQTRTIPETGRPAILELTPILPDLYEAVGSDTEWIAEYRPAASSSTTLFPIRPEDMIHPRFMDPEEARRGLSPLQAAARAVDSNIAGADWNLTALTERVGTDFLISFKHEMSEDQYEDAREWIKEDFAGPTNAKAPVVLGHEATAQRLSTSALDLDWLKGLDHWEKVICHTLGVPLSLAMPSPTFNNFREARRAFWEDSALGVFDTYAQALTHSLGPDYSRDPSLIRIRFNYTKVRALRGLQKETVESAARLWGMGVPFNEINKRLDLGFAEIEGGDVGYLPGAVLPVGVNSSDGSDF